MASKILTLTIILIFIALLLRKPDKIIKIAQAANSYFSKIWLALVKPV